MTRGRRISGETKLAGVIGDPVSHSHSPAMHNAAFYAAGLDWAYLAWRVAPGALPAAVKGLVALGVRGFNVTVPHKVAILPLLDEVGEEASAIGAVNTVTIRGDRLSGENTDAEGFLRSLSASGVRLADSHVVLLGAGGAARAVGHALVRAKVGTLHIANRRAPRAEALAEDLAGRGPGAVTAGPLEGKSLQEALGRADLIVHATSSGLSGGGLPVPVAWLPPGRTFYDLCYGRASDLMAAAVRAHGLRVITGEEMLLHQGALAFTRWTGIEPSLDAMRAALEGAVRAADEEESSSCPSK